MKTLWEIHRAKVDETWSARAKAIEHYCVLELFKKAAKDKETKKIIEESLKEAKAVRERAGLEWRRAIYDYQIMFDDLEFTLPKAVLLKEGRP